MCSTSSKNAQHRDLGLLALKVIDLSLGNNMQGVVLAAFLAVVPGQCRNHRSPLVIRQPGRRLVVFSSARDAGASSAKNKIP